MRAPEKINFETYATRRGAGPDFGEPGLHKSHTRISRKQWDRMVNSQMISDAERAERREELRTAYAAEVAAGTIVQPTRLDRLIATAAGHPDNPSVQAARRILASRYSSHQPKENQHHEAQTRLPDPPLHRQPVQHLGDQYPPPRPLAE